jgi:HEPN domain-containing protein
MNGIEASRRRSARQWTRYADEDLRLARHALTLTSGCPYRLIAYHAQQCAEKYLKAFLVIAGVDFPHTHNVSRLLELCADFGDWTEAVQEAEELTFYAVTARYPGPQADVTREEALRAIGIAETVRETLIGVLREKGVRAGEESQPPEEE